MLYDELVWLPYFIVNVLWLPYFFVNVLWLPYFFCECIIQMSSSESDRDSSDSEDHDFRVMEAITENQKIVYLAASFLS